MNAQAEPDLPFWKKLMLAVGRISESDDDELAYAYYCATVPTAREAEAPYVRAQFAKASYSTSCASTVTATSRSWRRWSPRRSAPTRRAA